MSLAQPSELLAAVVPVGQDTAPLVREVSVFLGHSTSGKQGKEQDQYLLSDLHLIIGALGFENLTFVHVLEEERSLPTQRGYYTGVITSCLSC